MNIIRPQLWTPFADRCPDCGRTHRRRRFNPLRKAVGDVMLDADGNVMLNAAGDVALECAQTCQYCSDSTPSSYTVSFTGVTLCACVRNGLRSEWVSVGGSLNGTFTLAQVAACSWSYTETPLNAITCVLKDNPSCTGSAIATADILYILLTKLNGSLALSAAVTFTGGAFGDLFVGSLSTSTCSGSQTITNSKSACNNVTNAWGYGGSAVVTG